MLLTRHFNMLKLLRVMLLVLMRSPQCQMQHITRMGKHLLRQPLKSCQQLGDIAHEVRPHLITISYRVILDGSPPLSCTFGAHCKVLLPGHLLLLRGNLLLSSNQTDVAELDMMLQIQVASQRQHAATHAATMQADCMCKHETCGCTVSTCWLSMCRCINAHSFVAGLPSQEATAERCSELGLPKVCDDPDRPFWLQESLCHVCLPCLAAGMT